MLILAAPTIDRVVDTLSPNDLTDITRRVFTPPSPSQSPCTDPSPGSQCPPRLSVSTPSYNALVMPAYIPSFGSAVKVVSVPRPGTISGLPATTLLLSPSGGALALLNARRLTALRNASASLLSARLLLPDAQIPQRMVCFGRGEQIKAHITLFVKAYTTLKEVIIVVRDHTAHSNISAEGVKITIRTELSPEELARADIIICATPSRVPLFDLPSLDPNHHVHIILIGSYTPIMREVPSSLILRARVLLLDDKDACLREAGELIDAERESGVYGMGEVLADPSLLVDGPSREPFTIFKSVGTGLQDVAIARLVYDRAVGLGVGVEVKDWE